MDTLLQIVASNAVLATFMAIAVWIATRFVRRPQVAYGLWMLVLVKLVTPPAFQVPIEFGGREELADYSDQTPRVNAVPADEPRQVGPVATTATAARIDRPPNDGASDVTASTAGVLDPEERAAMRNQPSDGDQSIGLSPANGTVGHAALVPTVGTSAPTHEPLVVTKVPWTTLIVFVWVTGSVAWFTLAGIRLVRFGRLVRTAGPAPEHLEDVAEGLARRFGLRRCPDLRVLGRAVPPLLWSVGRRSVIVLPAGLLTRLELDRQAALVAHELAHYRRGDHWVRWAESLILGLYWWHPVVWWACRRLHQAEEQCCDAWVLWACPEDAKGYAHTLLTTVEFLSVARPMLPVVASSLGHFGPLKRRLEAVLEGHTPRRLSWTGCGVVFLAALAVLPWSAGNSPARDIPEAVSMREPADDEAPAEERPPQNSRITGVVVAPGGLAVEGADIYLIGYHTRHPAFTRKLWFSALPIERQVVGGFLPETFAQTRTSVTGRFAVQGPVDAADYELLSVVVVAEGMALARHILDDRDADVDIRLPQMVPIRGHLYTPNGTPAAEVLVKPTWYTDGTTSLGISWPWQVVEKPQYWPGPVSTDTDGSFTLTGMPGGCHVSLQLIHPDFAYEHIIVDTGRGESRGRSEADLLLPTFSHGLGPARIVEGTVKASDTGEPLTGLLVEVRAESRDGSAPTTYGRTDEGGRYRIVSGEGESHYVTVNTSPNSGYLRVRKERRDWPKGAKTLVQDFALERGKMVRGRLVDNDTDKPIPGASVVYAPTRKNPFRKGLLRNKDYAFDNPTLTDDDGRFTVAGVSGPGYLIVETPERIYVRKPQPDSTIRPRPIPLGYTPIDVPLLGMLKEDVVIRLNRGRTVILQTLGPKGEALPSVTAAWEGINALLDWNNSSGFDFPDGNVVVRALDPDRMTRVFLVNAERNLGAVFDITPETGDGPIEVRLQPTGTIVGRTVTPAGESAAEGDVSLRMSFDPSLSQFTKERYLDLDFAFYSNFARESRPSFPYPEGRFELKSIVSGVPFGLSYGVYRQSNSKRNIMTVGPLEPGERRDVGDLVVGESE